MARFVFRHLPEKGALLDVGCGAGEFYRRIPKTFRGNYTGVDISAGMLDLFECTQLPLLQRALLMGDPRHLDLPAPHYQFVMAIGVLQYLASAEKEPFLHRIGELVAAGGTLVVDFYNNISDDGTYSSRYDDVIIAIKPSGLRIETTTAFTSIVGRIQPSWGWRFFDIIEEAIRCTGIYRASRIARRLGYRVFVVARKHGGSGQT